MAQKDKMIKSRIRLAADIGGTFTDVAAFDEDSGSLSLGKAQSTPDRLVDGIEGGVAKAGTDFAAAGLFWAGATQAQPLQLVGHPDPFPGNDSYADVRRGLPAGN